MSEKRRALLAAADQLFYQEGFGATGIDRVVAVAEVALGTLYHHFDGKVDLVVAVLGYREACYFAQLDEAAERKEGLERVLSLFDGLAAWATKRGGNGCLFLRAAAAHPDEAAIRARVLKHKKACLRLCRRRLQEAGLEAAAARRLAPSVFLLMEGAVASAGTLGAKTAIRQARADALALLERNPSRDAGSRNRR